eukprot:c29225_g2_i1 orf=691-3273(-)
MPDHGCGVKGLCLHTVANSIDDGTDVEFVEVDPCGRYGRYEEVLGKGAFKTVYRAFDRADGIEVAWNQVKVKDVLRTPEDLERLYSEVHLLRTLNHKNIIKFYHSWMDMETKSVNFITEIFTSGTLRQYRKRHKHVDMKALKNWSRQILRGLHYLHSHDPPVIHRDLKCDNIFVNGNQGEVKIGDLGLATILLRARAAHSVIGTPEFMAPELYEEEYNELVDIYSFGMCLLEMVTFEYPYSECTNAAQIYKKVISGKKPEALSKVTDLELREFINKCLVTASKRLPARELLKDPFLRPEGHSKVATQALPHLRWAITETDHLDALGVSIEEHDGNSATEKMSHIQQEMSPSIWENNFSSIASLPPLIAGDELKSLPCASTNEERIGRSVEFRVKGKRREDDTVFLRLRIADSEGQVRNIHFPFDIQGDTAMCVASEMVAELDFTGQDVTKIAEMIDAAILTLVPEWIPGVAIDETCSVSINNACLSGEGELSLDCQDSASTADDSYSKLHEVFNPLSIVSFENSCVGHCMFHSPSVYEPSGLMVSNATMASHIDSTMHGRFEEVMYHHPSTLTSNPGKIMSDGKVPMQMEGSVHGRFEELTYHCHRHLFTEEANCSMSSSSSDILKGAHYWDAVEEPNSPGSCMSHDSLPECIFTEDCSSFERDNRVSQSRDMGAFFNELDASKGFVSHSHQGWEGLLEEEPYLDHCTSSASLAKDKSCRQELGSQDAQQVLSAPSSLAFFPWLDDDDRLVVQELEILAQRHEQERRELQCKHEAALLELRNKWQRKKSSKFLSGSTGMHRCHSTLHIDDEGHGMQVDSLNELQLNHCQPFVSKLVLSRFHRIASESNLKKGSYADSSLK